MHVRYAKDALISYSAYMRVTVHGSYTSAYVLSSLLIFNTEMYGDPHFSVPLLHGGKLCYSIQGVPGLAFNLL